MLDYSYLLSISIILISTKFLGSITEKINLPQVVGALVAGILIGPAVFNIVHDTSFLDSVSQIGVIILMFMAGLDTDIGQLKRKGLSYLLIALFGVIIPLIGGSIAYMWFFHLNPGNQQDLLMAIFIGVILTATSVSITIEALKELGYANSSIGNAILGAAIVDDIIGIIVLSIICSFKDSNIHVSTVIIKIVIYFICMFILSLITVFGARFLDFKEDKRRISVYVLAFVFFVAYISEKYVGIADITGAYLVGIRNEIIKKTNVMSYLFFSPIFFASIGLKTELGNFTKELVIFSMILLVVAIITKILGAGLGARICGYDRFESLNIGIGMVSRGEVALIVAQKGFHLGLIDKHMFSPIILVVVVTTIVTPILLKKTLYLKKTQNS